MVGWNSELCWNYYSKTFEIFQFIIWPLKTSAWWLALAILLRCVQNTVSPKLFMHPSLIHFIYFDIYHIQWEMNWSWLDLTWPWLVLDLTLTGMLRVSCWWYLIGFRLARGYRRRPSSASSRSTADSLGGKLTSDPGPRGKMEIR